MNNKPRYTTPPTHDMNQWVRDALAFTDMTGPDLAAAMTRLLGRNYDKSMIQKMTTLRKVSKPEAEAISQLTGYPLSSESGDPFVSKLLQLLEHKRRLVQQLIDTLRSEPET